MTGWRKEKEVKKKRKREKKKNKIKIQENKILLDGWPTSVHLSIA